MPYDKKTLAVSARLWREQATRIPDYISFQAVRHTDSDSDSDSSEDSAGSNAPEFNLGRFCGRRTHLYHSLSHWEVRGIVYSCLLLDVDMSDSTNYSGVCIEK